MNALMAARSTPLPDPWVERIFARLFGLYGSLWLDRWRTDGGEQVGVELAKRTWAAELATFADQPQAIGRALEACSDLQYPPTLPEFRGLCRQHYQRPAVPEYEKRGPLELSGPQAAAVRQELAKLAPQSSGPQHDHLRWAKEPRSHAAMNLLCDAIAQGREAARLWPILQSHVSAGHKYVTDRARRMVLDAAGIERVSA